MSAGRCQGKTSKWLILAIAVVVTPLVLVGLISATRSPEEKLRSEAKSECKKDVPSILRAPATANFPGMSEFKVTVAGDNYMVESYVDAQNAYGANLRSDFYCLYTLDRSTNT